MNKLKQIKKYFKDSSLERAFMKLLVQVYIYNIPVAIALTKVTDNELALLGLHYKKPKNFEALCELIKQDIDYILEG